VYLLPPRFVVGAPKAVIAHSIALLTVAYRLGDRRRISLDTAVPGATMRSGQMALCYLRASEPVHAGLCCSVSTG
jgi:hypothetical protein